MRSGDRTRAFRRPQDGHGPRLRLIRGRLITSEGQFSRSGVAPGYIHGFTREEQDRLYEQALFLEPSVYEGIRFGPGARQILEVGSGVGAQTGILLRRFAGLRFHCVDASAEQLSRAREHLAEAIASGRVTLEQADAAHLPCASGSFDGAFVCWFLEHVPNPIDILREIRRVLKPGARLVCNEVQNASLHIHPFEPAILSFWARFNQHQREIGGDPFIGGHLESHLRSAGFRNIQARMKTYFFDDRAPAEREEFSRYWETLTLSGAPGLLAAGRVTEAEVQAVRDAFTRIRRERDFTFFVGWCFAEAEA